MINKPGIEDQALYSEENRLAETHIESGDYPAAAKLLVGIVEKDPRNWRAYNNMGIISWEKKSWEDAYTTFKHACELKPDYADALINLFDAALKLKRVKEIITLMKKSRELLPDNEEIGIIVDAIDSQGEDIYSSERALNIGYYNPRVEEANKLLDDGQLNVAMEKFLSINDSEGPSAEVFSGLGIISYYQKRYKDAFSLFYESIKLNPFKSDSYLNLMDAAKECGATGEAIKIFAAYSKEYPVLKGIEVEFNELAKA